MKNDELLRINYEQEFSNSEIFRSLSEIFSKQNLSRPIVLVNIGTDKSTSDSLGPLIGSFLKEKNPKILKIYS